jgi:hypothetical protein
VGLRNVLFGRSTPAPADLDHLFALPSAGITLETQLDVVSSGAAGLCFKAGSGEAQLRSDDEIRELLSLDSTSPMSLTTDELGFKWLVVHGDGLDDLVTRLHGANSTLVENGLGPRLLCCVFGFTPKTPPGEGALKLVYLMKQGTFYPFCPTGPESRNNELELRVRSFLSDDLPMEKELSRWMALWGLPVE